MKKIMKKIFSIKKILKIFLFFSIFINIFNFTLTNVEAKKIEINNKEIYENIKKSSIKTISNTWDIASDIETTWFKILKVVKFIFEWVLVIYVVYAWILMIISMWSEEENLSKWKNSLRYCLVALIFINIPWTIFNAFKQDNYWVVDWRIGYNSWFATPWDSSTNILINAFNFWETLNWDIIGFVEVWLSAITIFFIIISWIQIILSKWEQDKYDKAIKKITWSVIWLMFVWFIEIWKKVVFSWDIDDWRNLFETISNLALFFAGPLAISFLTLAAYYYITSNWDEEKTKKAKNIVINTVIATVILLASYTFLLDLATL